MQITNTTKWDTEHLRKLFSRCVDEVRKVEGRGRKKGIKIIIKNDHRSNGDMSGRASIGTYHISLKIGTNIDLTRGRARERLAGLFIHEYYHNLGYRYHDRKVFVRQVGRRLGYDVSFASDYPIEPAMSKPEHIRNLQLERYQGVMKKVKEHEAKLKREQRLLRKWKSKQRYYENILKAAEKNSII